MNALRTVPVIMNLAEEMRKRAPEAWLINFSNPSGIIAEAVLNHTDVKMIGLCNNAINMLAAIERTLGHKDFEYEYMGLNHLSWITSVMVDGQNLLADLNTGPGAKMKNIPDVVYSDDMLKAISAIPCYYLSYFYLRDEQIKKCMEAEKTRGEVCMELDVGLFEKYRDLELNVKPAELANRGGALYSTAAVSVVEAIQNGRDEYHVVNVKNNGAVPFMGNDDVVEVKCLVGKEGAKPCPVNTYSPFISGLMQSVKAYEKLAVSAALTGSHTDALAALMVHPLIGDYAKAAAVLEDMLEANREFVPAFFK
jgi:6-phospho-beta-glucosidase